jgi:hypothetical protein
MYLDALYRQGFTLSLPRRELQICESRMLSQAALFLRMTLPAE